MWCTGQTESQTTRKLTQSLLYYRKETNIKMCTLIDKLAINKNEIYAGKILPFLQVQNINSMNEICVHEMQTKQV